MSVSDEPGGMAPEDVREIVRAVEDGWKALLEETKRGQRERMATLQGRVHTLTWALVVFGVTVVVACALGLAALSSQADDAHTTADRLARVVADQQTSREAALVDRCRQSNDLAEGLREFVRRAAPALLPLAERKFDVQPDCGRYARRLLRAP